MVVWVALEVVPGDVPLPVRADPGQLESALFNLVLNANNAIADTGSIVIRLSKSEAGQAEIVVSDSGAGMPKSVQLID